MRTTLPHTLTRTRAHTQTDVAGREGVGGRVTCVHADGEGRGQPGLLEEERGGL